MRALYLASVWLHILAATAWLGGMLFLVLVVVPLLRRGDRKVAAALMRDSGQRFRTVGWVCFAVLLVTGTYNLWWRGVRVSDLFDRGWVSMPFGSVLWLKLSVFVVVLGLSVVHDFYLGPRASRALSDGGGSAEAERLRRAASVLGRLTALLALVLFALAVMLVRGLPW